MLLVMTVMTAAEVELEMLLMAASPATATKELIEDIIMIEPAVSGGIATLLLSFKSLLSVLIVDAFFFGVAESLVCVSDALEALLRSLGIVLVLVRVILDRHLLKRLLYLLLCGTTLQTQ